MLPLKQIVAQKLRYRNAVRLLLRTKIIHVCACMYVCMYVLIEIVGMQFRSRRKVFWRIVLGPLGTAKQVCHTYTVYKHLHTIHTYIHTYIHT
jgi:hypothetical protein